MGSLSAAATARVARGVIGRETARTGDRRSGNHLVGSERNNIALAGAPARYLRRIGVSTTDGRRPVSHTKTAGKLL